MHKIRWELPINLHIIYKVFIWAFISYAARLTMYHPIGNIYVFKYDGQFAFFYDDSNSKDTTYVFAIV